MMTVRAELGPLLKRYRLAAGLSQEALAERAQVSARAISDAERGLHLAPHPHTLESLAAALALAPDQRALLLAAARPELAEPLAASPTRPAPTTPTISSQLPIPPTALIGRENERARAIALLRQGAARLLTVTGPSGVGKTRLALEVAADLRETFTNGVAFVELAPVRDAGGVPSALAQALGLREQPTTALSDQLGNYLRDKRLLLVLDNAEHLLEAAPLVADLLARSPRLAILVASRAPLRVRAEQTLALAPLPLDAASALFVARARMIQPDGVYAEAVVAAICSRVDCLPLAIELAAAQVKALSAPQLLQHLRQRLPLLRGGARDLPMRQRAMEDAIAWSYDALSESEQRLFRALGVFVGGCTLDAAMAVCWTEGTVAAYEAAASLGALVDASLVQASPATDGAVRFHLLELLREYALERLHAAGEAEDCQRRHAAYFARLGGAADARPGSHVAEAELGLELSNARAALEWAEAQRDADLGLRLTSFARLWHFRGQIGEAIAWQERMLALDLRLRQAGKSAAPLALRIERLSDFARTLLSYGRMERANELAAEAVQVAQDGGEQTRVSAAFATLGLVAQAHGDLSRAEAAFTQSYLHARRSEHADLTARALYHRAELAQLQGDLPRAANFFEEALADARASGSAWDVAIITTMLGRLANQEQRYPQARARFRESLALFREFHSPTFSAWCLEGLVATLCAESRLAVATRFCAAAASWRISAATPLPPAEREAFASVLATAKAALGQSAFRAEWAAGAALTQEMAIAEALAVTEDSP